jgi:hypothetical protein
MSLNNKSSHQNNPSALALALALSYKHNSKNSQSNGQNFLQKLDGLKKVSNVKKPTCIPPKPIVNNSPKIDDDDFDSTNRKLNTLIDKSNKLEEKIFEISNELERIESHSLIIPKVHYVNNDNYHCYTHLHSNNMYIINSGTSFTLEPDCNPFHLITIINNTDKQITIHTHELIYNTFHAPRGSHCIALPPNEQFIFNYVKSHDDKHHHDKTPGKWFLQFS